MQDGSLYTSPSFIFFGETEMSKTTAGQLEPTKMDEIKKLIVSKFAEKRSIADKEELWRKCRVAIGQKCKQLRAKKPAHISPVTTLHTFMCITITYTSHCHTYICITD